MKEKYLLNYLRNEFEEKKLASELNKSRKSNGTTFSLDIEEYSDSTYPFLVIRSHAIKLCNAVISHGLSFENLNTIAFIISCSESFNVDRNDEIAIRFFDDWKETSVGFAWNESNVNKWKTLLENDIDNFVNGDLKVRID